MLIGYARVSKGDDQSNRAQARALAEAGCKRVFEEKASGGRWERPELHRMLDQLRDGVIPALAGPRQALERWIEVPVQFPHRSLQQLQCGPTARSPGGVGAQPIYSGVSVALSTQSLLCGT